MYLATDPLHNTITNGIKEDINVCFEQQRYRAAIILIYSGIDSMAFLNLPVGEDEVRGADFVRWVERYIHFPGKEKLTGADLYGARCSMLHTYGVKSKMSRNGKCRMVGYFDQCEPPIIYQPGIQEDFVLVSVAALRKAFFDGIDQFLIEAFQDKQKAVLIEERLQWFVRMTQFTPAERSTQ